MVMWAVMALGSAAGLTRTRRSRRLAVRTAERLFPGRLEVIGARSLFPATGGAEIVFRVTDDPDAVVRLRVGVTEPADAALAAAMAEGLARAAAWRGLDTAFRDGGWEVYALGKEVADPWIAAEVRDGAVGEMLDGIGGCLARWPGAPATSVLIAAPDLVRTLPGGRDEGRPTMLRLTARRRLAALTGRQPYYRASFEWRDGAPLPGSGRLGLVRPFDDGQRFAAAVEASAAAWLADADPAATVCSALGVWDLLPERTDRLTGYVIYRDEPEPGPVYLGKHALRVTTDLAGALTTTPTPLRNVRTARGPLRLPPL